MFKSIFVILAIVCSAMAQNALFKIPLGNSVLLGQARYGITPLTYSQNIFGVNSLYNPYAGVAGLGGLGGLGGLSGISGLNANGAVVSPNAVVSPSGAVVAPGTVVGSTLTGGVPVTGLTNYQLTGLSPYTTYTGYNTLGYNSGLYGGRYGGGGMNIPTFG